MRLPLWRLVLGVAVLGSLVAVLAALGPIYVDDYRLKSSVQTIVKSAAAVSMPDEALRTAIERRASDLDLPVQDSDLAVSHPGNRVQVDLKYVVAVKFPLYNVDLHFHTSAHSP